MNSRILLSIILVAAVAFICWKIPSHHQSSSAGSKSDLASIQAPDSNEKNDSSKMQKPQVRQQVVAQMPVKIREPNLVETHKSGKYAVQISPDSLGSDDEIKKRDDYLKQNRTGYEFSSGDMNYVLMKLRASMDKEGPDHNRKLDHDFQSIDEESAGHAIVDGRTYPVVYNQNNGRLGLVTGVLLIRSLEPDSAQNLAKNYPMDLQTYDPDIKLASYKIRTGEGVYDIYNRIKQNEKVNSVTVEVLDSYKGY
jgi:hypothetical protein